MFIFILSGQISRQNETEVFAADVGDGYLRRSLENGSVAETQMKYSGVIICRIQKKSPIY